MIRTPNQTSDQDQEILPHPSLATEEGFLKRGWLDCLEYLAALNKIDLKLCISQGLWKATIPRRFPSTTGIWRIGRVAGTAFAAGIGTGATIQCRAHE